MRKRRGALVDVAVLPMTVRVSPGSMDEVVRICWVDGDSLRDVMRMCGRWWTVWRTETAWMRLGRSVMETPERTSASKWFGSRRSASGRRAW
jgi:hypothetical protein